MIYLDENLHNHPKIFRAGVQLGPTGPALVLALYVSCIGYARQFLTDGVIPIEVFSTNRLLPNALEVAKIMASRKVKLFDQCRGGYRIHDFHDWNKKASEIKEKRAKDRAKKRRQRTGHPEGVPGGVPPVSLGDVPPGLRADSPSPQSPVPSHVRTSVQRASTNQQADPNVRVPSALRARAKTPPCGKPVEKSEPTNGTLVKLAHAIVDEKPTEDFTELKALMKDQCAKLGFIYDAESVGSALEGALAQREQRRTH